MGAPRLKAELPLGSSPEDARRWLEANHAIFTEVVVGREIVSELQRVKGDGLICASWSIHANLLFSEAERLEAHQVFAAGECL